MHLLYKYPVTSENQFHCTRLYTAYPVTPPRHYQHDACPGSTLWTCMQLPVHTPAAFQCRLDLCSTVSFRTFPVTLWECHRTPAGCLRWQCPCPSQPVRGKQRERESLKKWLNREINCLFSGQWEKERERERERERESESEGVRKWIGEWVRERQWGETSTRRERERERESWKNHLNREIHCLFWEQWEREREEEEEEKKVQERERERERERNEIWSLTLTFIAWNKKTLCIASRTTSIPRNEKEKFDKPPLTRQCGKVFWKRKRKRRQRKFLIQPLNNVTRVIL